MCLYGGGFLSFFLSSWSCRSSFSACSSRNRTAASSKAEEGRQKSAITNTNHDIKPIKGQILLLPTFFIGRINPFPHLFLAVGVHVHVREDSGLVGPQVVVGAEEMNGELADIMPHSLDVFWDCFGMADLCRPPPYGAENGRIKDLMTCVWLFRFKRLCGS